MKKLVEVLNQASKAYYQEDREIMSNREYDALYDQLEKMEKETLYKFFDGKASREEKEAVRIWLESSPENEQELFKEREFFDAMILSGSTKVAGMEKKSR